MQDRIQQIKALRDKHAKLIQANNDLTAPAAVAIRKEIITLTSGPKVMEFSHCQSCGSAARRTSDNDGYSECCNELIISGGCDAYCCFHLV